MSQWIIHCMNGTSKTKTKTNKQRKKKKYELNKRNAFYLRKHFT